MIKLITRLACLGMFFLMAAGGLQGVATNRYVATNVPASAYPFDSWENAGTNIIEVVVVANANNAGDIVFVSNGTYYLTNQISVTNIVVTNFTGDRTKVIIDGNCPTTTNRCFYMNHVNAIVSGLTITNGYTDTNNLAGCGGGVYLTKGTLKDCLITGNRCAVTSNYGPGGGGGIFMSGGTADHCSVVGNIAAGVATADRFTGGGGISAISMCLITNCYVAYNIASNYIYGGGFFLTDNGARVYNCIIVGNQVKGTYGSSSGVGGGIFSHGGTITEIKNCTINSNKSVSRGGAVATAGSSAGKSVRIRNCLIIYNESEFQDGGGIALASGGASPVTIESCTIVSNKCGSSSKYGGGIYFQSTALSTNVWNCIIYDNYGGSLGVDLYDSSGGNCKTAVMYSCTSPGASFDIVGLVTNPPSFVDANNGNYHLRQNSPCINKGTNQVWMTGGIDYDGSPRIRYGTVDMGCYETIYNGTIFTVP